VKFIVPSCFTRFSFIFAINSSTESAFVIPIVSFATALALGTVTETPCEVVDCLDFPSFALSTYGPYLNAYVSLPSARLYAFTSIGSLMPNSAP